MPIIAFFKHKVDSDTAFIATVHPLNEIITCFREVGQAIPQSYALDKRLLVTFWVSLVTTAIGSPAPRIVDELMFFVEVTGCEQACQTRDGLPSVEDY